jgi:hypothetical protein
VKTAIITIIILAAALITASCKKNVEPPDIQGVTLLPIDTNDVSSEWVDLNWTKFTEPGFKTYEIHASKTPNFTPSSSTHHTDDDVDQRDDTFGTAHYLSPNTVYFFKIRVVTIDGKNADSNERSAKTNP